MFGLWKTNLIKRESQITEGMRMFGNMELEVITILILHLAMRTNVFAEIIMIALLWKTEYAMDELPRTVNYIMKY